MKRTIAICGFFLGGIAAVFAAEPGPTPVPPPLEKIPLPPGPLVDRMPKFAMWRIQFAYTSDQPVGKSGSAEKQNVAEKVSDVTILPPRSTTITRTSPYYHVSVMDKSGRTLDLWGDGGSVYLQTPDHPAPYLPGLNPSGTSAIPSALDFSLADFPDVEWVSPKTYLGVIKGESNSYLVFRQSENGPTVWIDAGTRRPVRWQSAGEVRKFEYLDAPAEKLAMPTSVIEATKMVRRIDEITSHRPPRGS